MSLPAALANAQIPGPVLGVLARLTERGFAAYLVGGSVRDLLRGKKAKDFDIATSARPEEVQRAFDKVIPTGIQHGTVTVLWKGVGVEVTTFRKEGAYLDGRRPSEVSFHSDIEADLSRRDFTINAMAFSPVRAELCDPFGGQEDLQRGIIRAVGAALDRFSEDGLRALRAVRFAAVLGFTLEESTLAAIPQTLDVFSKVAVERVREEFTKLLLSDRPALGLELLRQSGLFGRFLPEILEGIGSKPSDAYAGDLFEHALATVEVCAPDLDLRLAALLHDISKPRGEALHDEAGARLAREILTRLKFPTKVIERVSLLVRWHLLEPVTAATDADVRRFLAKLGPENVDEWLALAEANRKGREKDLDRGAAEVAALRDRLSTILRDRPALFPRDLALNGGAIMRVLNVGPSPLVGEATRFLMERVFEDPSLNQADRLEPVLVAWKAAQKS